MPPVSYGQLNRDRLKNDRLALSVERLRDRQVGTTSIASYDVEQ
jgi:hypothetical protein